MTNKELIDRELERYKKYNTPLNPRKYSNRILPRLLKKFKYCGMSENSYCCHGLEECCWYDVIEEGVWFLTLDEVKRYIKREFKNNKRYFYYPKKFGKRFYMYEDNDVCYIYLYLRDVIDIDYFIWFSNKDR